MATTTYLSQPGVITIAGTDLRDQCSAVSLTIGNSPLESTAFGDAGQRYVSGLQSVEGTLTMYVDYGATGVEGVVYGEVGQGDTVIVVKKEDAAVSATNPEYTISGTMIADMPVTYTVGELQMMEISFSGGTFLRDVTP